MAWRFLKFAGTRIVTKEVALSVEGIENVPATGGVILCCNHEHHLLDGAILMSLSRRPTHVVVAGDWANTGVARIVMPRLNRGARWPMVDRSASVQALGRNRAAIAGTVDLLAAGRVVVMFPEGYPAVDSHGSRKSPGELLPFEKGLELVLRHARRATGTDVPVIPVGFTFASRTDTQWDVRVRFGDMRVGAEATAERLRGDVALLIS